MPEVIAVDLARGGEAGMEFLRGLRDLHDTQFGRERGIQCCQPPVRLSHPANPGDLIRGQFEMNGLPQRMNACISASGSMKHHPLPNDDCDRLFQGILHSSPVLLALKAAKSGSVVGDQQAQLHQVDDCESSQSCRI